MATRAFRFIRDVQHEPAAQMTGHKKGEMLVLGDGVTCSHDNSKVILRTGMGTFDDFAIGDEVEPVAEEQVPDHEGYFWVKRLFTPVYPGNSGPFTQWTLAYWREEEWWEFHGEEPSYEFDEILEIGDEVVKPSKYQA